MIAFSSFRPFSKCSPEIWHNQVCAKQSWDRVFESIIYFNEPEPRLSTPQTGFVVPKTDKPTIKEMAALAGMLDDWVCIINADIQVSNRLVIAGHQLKKIDAWCATSSRYQLPENAVMDGGLDFFAARPEVWLLASLRIPEDFCLGRVVWDNWMLNFFISEFSEVCYDITPCKSIFHPKHGERTDQNLEVPNDPYLKTSRRAQQTLTI